MSVSLLIYTYLDCREYLSQVLDPTTMVWSEPQVEGDLLPSPRASTSMLAVPVDGGMAPHSFGKDGTRSVGVQSRVLCSKMGI